MQTGQRKIPVSGGTDGKPANYHWTQLLPLYEAELSDFRRRVAAIKAGKSGEADESTIQPLPKCDFKVLSPGAPNSEAAWQEALEAIKNADGRRTLYLDRSQRRKLLETISEEAAPFVRALCLLPLRPGALAALHAGDFDKRTAELTVGKDKTGKPRRIQLPAGAAKLLTTQAANKLPGAPLLMRANGKAWDKNSWKLPIAAAVTAGGLPGDATAYTLRHSTITDLVSAGLPLLTIAQISGTSAEMIERHYGHLASDAAVKALGELAL